MSQFPFIRIGLFQGYSGLLVPNSYEQKYYHNKKQQLSKEACAVVNFVCLIILKIHMLDFFVVLRSNSPLNIKYVFFLLFKCEILGTWFEKQIHFMTAGRLI